MFSKRLQKTVYFILISLFSLVLFAAAYADTQADTYTDTGASQPRLLVWGDSLSAAYGIPVEKGWVSLLKNKLGTKATVINASISGETTQGGLTRLPDALNKYQPDILLLELGGNDGLRGIRTEVMKKNLDGMIELAKKRNIEVVLLGIKIPPNYGITYTTRFERVFTDLAEKHSLNFVPFILENIATDYGLMQADGIHPNVKAQPILLNNIMPALNKTLVQ